MPVVIREPLTSKVLISAWPICRVPVFAQLVLPGASVPKTCISEGVPSREM
jgi:hypothetical protein